MNNTVRQLRQEKNWTQQELANRLKVSRQTINAIENQRYDPSLSLAFDIAATFNTTIERIFEP
ncbi:MAG: helix-turn-helix transcriptional regulator [Pseudomonadota bacterium]